MLLERKKSSKSGDLYGVIDRRWLTLPVHSLGFFVRQTVESGALVALVALLALFSMARFSHSQPVPTQSAPPVAAHVGGAAPDFQATDSHGRTQTLAQYRGKYVVLEWHNQGCPYTKKHYVSGNMQALQKEWTAKGVIWFTVISSARGKQGYVAPAEENSYLSRMHAAPTAVLLDPDGNLGRLYDVKTTPQMVVIDPAGKVIYDGAIDDRPTADPDDARGAHNYVSEALTAAMAGKPVPTPYTRPYGCSVKYQD